MDCAWIARDDVFERYGRDELGPDDRDAFEEHYFSCAACFDKVQTYHALRLELPSSVTGVPATSTARSRGWWWVVLPATALVLIVVVAALWLKTAFPTPPRGERAAAAPAAGPGRPSAAQAAPTGQAGDTAAPRQQSSPPAAIALSVLARVEPPLYIPATLRGPTSEAAERFRAAMARYSEGNYTAAIPDLRAATTLKPDVAQYTFFLAICQLLTDRVDSAVASLRRTIALGNSPYLEEAHFYLAKARLRQGDIPAARAELQRTIESRGRLEEAAQSLLVQIDALPEGKDHPPGK
jgi:TolA-binding protein